MPGSGMNVLLVMMDSVRADRLGCYGGPGGHTPSLDALAAQGVRFANAIGESTWTLPMAFTLHTGLTPREHRAESHRRLPDHLPTLASLMQQAGYATFGGSGNPFMGAGTGLDGGFEVFTTPRQGESLAGRLKHSLRETLGWGDPGGAVLVERFAEWVRRVSRPWFATLWLNDAHHPYRVPGWLGVQSSLAPLSRWQRLCLTDDLRHPRRLVPQAQQLGDYCHRLHAGATAYVDALVGRLAEELARGNLWDTTLVILAADHGDMLGEGELMGHGPAAGMYQPLIRVPLVLRAPGLGETVSPALVQVADITYTAATAAGVAQHLPPTAAERVDLREAAFGLGRAAAFCERDPLSGARLERERKKTPRFDFAPHLCGMTAVVADGWKLITRSPGPDELYCLTDDPGETRNLLNERSDRADFLASLVADYHTRAAPHAATAGLEHDDAAIVDRRLQNLGYL